jgi:diguanylate cyclase (GGDEF)-like protein
MNYLLLPDLAAMALLLGILYFLRRRHPRGAVNLWLIGLVFIFFEAVIHAVYPTSGSLRITAHVAALNCFYVAGAIFLWASGREIFPRGQSLFYFLVNSVPAAALLCVYGLAIKHPGLYQIVSACGLLVGVFCAFAVARTWRPGRGWWWLVVVPVCTWTPIWFFATENKFRDAAYFILFALYFVTAVVFQWTLPRKSLGKVAIVAGFVIWSMVFLFHSWVANHPGYEPIADEIWNLQKFLVTIGMLLVLLEQQVATNEWYAFHDHLTGLPNGRLFEGRLADALKQSLENNTRTALLMVDLDGFKLINDSYGHDVGDELLRHISKNLRGAIRTPDTLARLGGDEFVIIATNLPSNQPADRIIGSSADRISGVIQRPLSINGADLMVKASIGVALYPDDADDETALRRLADQRMYEQKRQISLSF